MGCRLIGRWRIVEADLWDRDHLDLCGPAMLDIGADGHGEIAFGAFQASLDLAYGRSDVSFDWEGCDEVRGSGSAELLDDGSLEIEFEYHRGDDATLKAPPRHFFSRLLERTRREPYDVGNRRTDVCSARGRLRTAKPC
jgi:hypothetical protein